MNGRLDSPRGALGKARALLLTAVVVWPAAAGATDSMTGPFGALLPEGSQKVGENRYRTHRDFEGTKKFYNEVYPQNVYPRKAIINQPGIKAMHIVNPSGRGFEGLNIYLVNEEVRIYVVPAGDKKKPKTK